MRVDVAVVGGGVVGLGFALGAARRGRSVAVFDRAPGAARGASVRNFGMVWPVGQPPGELYRRALHSRKLWLGLVEAAGVWGRASGSVHLAYRADEAAVLREFAAADTGVVCEYLDAGEAAARFPAVSPAGLIGALYSPVELALDPPQAIRQLTRYLAETHRVQVRTGVAVVGVDARPGRGRVRLGTGEAVDAGLVVVATGEDCETLFPGPVAAAGAVKCKLQMLATGPQPGGWRLGPHVAGGLTLLHYPSFRDCPSLPALRARVTAELPDYIDLGIHVMASQNAAGEVVIGDSHLYGPAITPFDREDIDARILTYLRGLVRLPDWAVARRWNGVYLKLPDRPYLLEEVQPGCLLAAGFGGAGMTLALAAAEEWWAGRD